MTTPNADSVDGMPDWYDPFDEPRTLPAGWALTDPAPEPARPAPTRPAAAPILYPTLTSLLLFRLN